MQFENVSCQGRFFTRRGTIYIFYIFKRTSFDRFNLRQIEEQNKALGVPAEHLLPQEIFENFVMLKTHRKRNGQSGPSLQLRLD